MKKQTYFSIFFLLFVSLVYWQGLNAASKIAYLTLIRDQQGFDHRVEITQDMNTMTQYDGPTDPAILGSAGLKNGSFWIIEPTQANKDTLMSITSSNTLDIGSTGAFPLDSTCTLPCMVIFWDSEFYVR